MKTHKTIALLIWSFTYSLGYLWLIFNIFPILVLSGKKDEKGYQESSSHSTTFSGYLTRKKAGVWKNRWCVVKDKSLHCYKDFGANLPELELTLEGCVVESLPDREGEKPYSFVLTADKDRLQFAAENDADLEEWLEVLEKEVLKSEGEDVDDDINSKY